MNKPGVLYWLTGLSGAGKSTVGKLLFQKIRHDKSNVVLLDGDELRIVFGDDLGYTEEDRRVSAGRNARLCAFLTAQGIDVVCCTISMFDEVRKWNREHIPRYREIYLRVPLAILAQRNQKGMYLGENAIQEALVGIGVKMEEPKTPDLCIDNDGSLSPAEVVDLIWKGCIEA